jgi:SAM-dependent methyltransferase
LRSLYQHIYSAITAGIATGVVRVGRSPENRQQEFFMEFDTIIAATKRPAVYSKGTAQMWVDEYISVRLLEVHLNPDIELASRKETTINKTVAWILDKVPGEKLEILDLGCGPGLYAEKLASRGHRVTGMDFSANSIRYASAMAGAPDYASFHNGWWELRKAMEELRESVHMRKATKSKPR